MMDAESTPTLSQPELWARIRDAELPGQTLPPTRFRKERQISFGERLNDAHKLTEQSQQVLEAEYRRFLYLKALDGGALTPSRRVDQAWHLHLETPDGAWTRFCDEVIGVRIEHRTGLSRAESRAGYERTQALYRREFGEEPPKKVWPSRADRLRGFIANSMVVMGVGMVLLGYWVTRPDNPMLAASVDERQLALGAAPICFVMGICLIVLSIPVYVETDLDFESSG